MKDTHMSETQAQTTDTEVTVIKRRGRPPNPNKVVLQPKTPKVKATEPEPEVVETVDFSGVIDDFSELQEAARIAMGDYASKADDNIVDTLKGKRKGSDHVFRIHPLNISVMTGDDAINSRRFDNDVMRERIVTFGKTLLNGVDTPLVGFFREGKLYVENGETRIRSILHNYIRAAAGEDGFEGLLNPENAPLGLVPIIIKSGNDRDRILRVAAAADQRPFTPIEVANNIYKAYRLGEQQDMSRIANIESIAKSYGRSNGFVIQHLSMMELPSAVIGLLNHEPLSVHMAMQAWKVTNENPTKTMEILEEAVVKAKAAAGGNPYKVMPKHAPKLRVVVDNDGSDASGSENKGAKSEKVSKPSASAVDKATDFIIDLMRDLKWKVEDGYVSIDTSASSPAFNFTCEEFLKHAKALGFRIPADLDGIDEEEV